MKRFYFIARYIVVFAVVLGAKSHTVFAQQSSSNQWRSIRTHNVRPDMMAYFIDSKHQQAPLEFSIPSRIDPHYSLEDFLIATKAGAPKLDFHGVLAVDNSQNTLWVLSDQNTFDQTQRFVDFMDHPLIQCELELQVVKISKQDVAAFETPPIPSDTPSHSPSRNPYQLSILTADAQKTLQKLVLQGKAKVLNSPRVTTLNHLQGSLSSATTTPVSVEIKTGDAPYAPLAFDTTNGKQLSHITQFRTAFTPHINEASNALSLDLDISAGDGINAYDTNPQTVSANARRRGVVNYGQTIWFRDRMNPPLTTRINIANNQPFMITGLTFNSSGAGDKGDDIVLFITAKILGRTR